MYENKEETYLNSPSMCFVCHIDWASSLKQAKDFYKKVGFTALVKCFAFQIARQDLLSVYFLMPDLQA